MAYIRNAQVISRSFLEEKRRGGGKQTRSGCANPSLKASLIPGGRTGELHQGVRGNRGARLKCLRRAPGINDSDLVDTGDGAARRARLLRQVLAVALLVR